MPLHVSEIFVSVQGETTAAGFPSLFIRLAGCNLRCSFCDTSYSWEDGLPLTVDGIIQKALSYRWVNHVTVTGGEPLFQNETPALVRRLLDEGFRVRVETNGSFPIDLLPDGCERMIDIKPPSSGEQKSFYRRNIQLLTARDEVKLLAADEADLTFAFDLCRNELSGVPCVINISPVTGFLDAAVLAQRIICEKLNIRLNLQLHKVIWPEGEPR
jgi:7-carboxy-7-deazaguanine synthase